MMTGFKHQEVADLAWALSSPPIMRPNNQNCVWPSADWYQQLAAEAEPWIKQLDSDPAELIELLAKQKDRRLGKYFETLWLFWLLKQTRYEVVETNLQIIIDGQTLGEMDLILFDTVQRCFVHWELAVKFYLGIGDTRQLSNWHGPGQRDRLDKKFEHLANRQSVISQLPAVKTWLAKKEIRIDINQVILKGRLYYMRSTLGSLSINRPFNSDNQHLKSIWIELKELDEFADNSARFRPLINLGWMAEISTKSKREVWSKQQLLRAIKNQEVRLPLHVECVKPLFNINKLFIVGNRWCSSIS